MSFLGWIQNLRDGKLVARHVDRIVARYLGLVREGTIARAAGMPRAEARGYVRVKALAIIAPAVEKTEGKGELIPARLYDVVTTLAVERLVVEIMRQLGSAQAQPAKRRAA
ncbi:MAG: hypothetical protein JNK76_20420 [Planctomycetales bacterium]|nr:hypothetical protein [Planctomycetales bacterium]MBN8625913.1 hypothetical protein [Planctomycetota bacterium]